MLNKEDLNKLYQYACSLTNNDDQAYDLVHDAVIKLQKHNPDNEVAYSKTIIRNMFFDKYKKEKNLATFDIDELASPEALESIVITKDSVKNILNNIAPDERELLYEWAVEGKTLQSIADDTQTKLGTVLSKISRLRKKIIKLESDNEFV